MTTQSKPLSIEDLVAVHCTDYFPEKGLMKTLGNYQVEVSGDGTNKALVQIPRETLHFSLNGAHTSINSTNGSGNWTNKKYAVLFPLENIVERLAVLDSADSYVIGNYELREGSEVIVDREKLSIEELSYLSQIAGSEIKPYSHNIDVDDVLEDFLPEPIPTYDVNLNRSKVKVIVKPAKIPLNDFVEARISQRGYNPMEIAANGWRNENSKFNENALYEIARERALVGDGTNRLAGSNPHERSPWSLLETAVGLLACELDTPLPCDETRVTKLNEYKETIVRYNDKLKGKVVPSNVYETEAMERINSTVRNVLDRFEEYKKAA